jgi:hypothetical protein
MSILIKSCVAFAFCFGMFVGYVVGRMEWAHEDCYDATDKYQRYEAWLSVKNGIYRCFWIEKEYPWRVRVQGIIDVK